MKPPRKNTVFEMCDLGRDMNPAKRMARNKHHRRNQAMK